MKKIKDIFWMTWRGRSIQRILLKWACKKIARREEFFGKIIDLGSGNNDEYYKYLKIDRKNLVRVDLDPSRNPDVVADINDKLPFDDASADAVLLLNVIYIARYPQALLEEVKRILKPGGKLFMWAPLMFNEAPEPVDYWRFTSQGVAFIAERAGLRAEIIEKVGERFTARLYLIESMVKIRFILFFWRLWAISMDKMLPRSVKRHHPAPIGHLALLKKTA